MVKSTKNSEYELKTARLQGQGKKIILLPIVLLGVILMINIVSALLETSKPMELTKGQPLTFDKKEIAYNPIWDKYAPIKIDTWLDIPMISKTLVEAYIDTHTDSCGISCSSTMVLKTYEKAPLIQDIKFYTINGEDKYEQPIRSYQFYIKTSEKDIEVNDYKWTCTPTGIINLNGTEQQSCENKLIGTHIEKEPLWKTYNIGEEVVAGVYEVKLDGQKKPSRTIDWQIKTNGIWTTDWATWVSSPSVIVNRSTNLSAYGITLNEIVNHSSIPLNFSNDVYLNRIRLKLATSDTTTLVNVSLRSNGVILISNETIITTNTGGAGNPMWFNFTFPEYTLSSDTNYTITATKRNDPHNLWWATVEASGLVTDNMTFELYGIYANGSVHLNSPANNYVSPTNSIDFNCSATVTGGATLTNMSLWTNSSGSLALNQSVLLSTYNVSANGIDLSSSASVNKVDGAIIWANNNTVLNTVTKHNSATADYIFLTTNADGTGELAKAKFIGDVATLNYPLTKNTKYYLVTNLTTQTLRYNTGANAWNYSADKPVMWIGGVDAGAENYVDGLRNWISLNTTTSPTSATNIFNVNTAQSLLWTCQACDSDGDCGFASENRTVLIDTSAPSITINSPTTIMNYGTMNGSETLNYSITDTNFASAWYNYNGTNVSLVGAINTTTFIINRATGNNLTLYANDSVGNVDSLNRAWNYRVFENNITYITPTTSGITNPFTINLTYDSSYSGIAVFLNYNSTDYTMSSSDTGTTRIYTYNLFAPAVASQVNNTFYFKVALSNSSGTFNINSASYNQTVNPFLIDNCTTNSNVLLNMTMFDEESLLGINGTIEALVNIYAYGTDTLISTYNNTFNYITPTAARICTNATGTYRMDYTLKHYGNSTTYFIKYRNIQNYTITNSSFTQEIKLYNLLLASAYTFRITLTGTNLNPLVVSVYKQYIAENTFRLVESPLTSSSDEAITHLVPQSAIYNFVISYMGRTIQTFNNYQVTCQNPSIGQCTIILPLGEEFEPMPNFNNPLNVSLTNLLNNTGHILYTTFTSTNGESHTVRQLVIKNDGFGNTTICNNSASGTTGTIVCNIPIQYQNKSFFLQTFVNERLSGSGLFTQGEDPNWYGADVIIELFMYSSLVLLMTTHPILIVIGAMLGLVFSVSLIWISAGSFSSIVASLFFFVAAGVIIIWQISRKI